jgi:hypothetical protein
VNIQNTTLDDIAHVIGFSATLRLAAWFGDGSNLYVPQKVEEGQLLVRLLGRAAAMRLSAEWPGETLYVPRLHNYETDVQRRVIGRMLEQGFSPREIGVHQRLSKRRVEQVARELEEAGLLAKTADDNLQGARPRVDVQPRPARARRRSVFMVVG